MIIDNIKNFPQYFSLNNNFQAVNDYLNSIDILKLEKGEYLINENAYLIIAYDETNENFIPKLEAHKKYIDMQFAISGEFSIGWKFLEDCTDRLTEFDTEKDFELFADQSQCKIDLKPGVFCLLFPNDAHVPMPPNGNLIKGIIKIKI
ncbi:MAG: YhcH/YjgK/YiaL family protein [Chloroherpetonaceae bacterium]